MTIATNTWVFPLQAALLAGWLLWRRCYGQPLHPPALGAGLFGGLLLLYPFLAGFADAGSGTAIRWVTQELRTPLAQFLAQHWPLLIMALLSLGLIAQRRLALYFAALFLGLLVFSELFFADDPSGGMYERTNSTMKWWGWIWTGSLLALGTLLLAHGRQWVQGVLLLSCCW